MEILKLDITFTDTRQNIFIYQFKLRRTYIGTTIPHSCLAQAIWTFDVRECAANIRFFFCYKEMAATHYQCILPNRHLPQSSTAFPPLYPPPSQSALEALPLTTFVPPPPPPALRRQHRPFSPLPPPPAGRPAIDFDSHYQLDNA